MPPRIIHEEHSPPTTSNTGMWKASEVMEAFRRHYLKDVWFSLTYKELECEPHYEDEKYSRRADMFTIFPKGIYYNTRLAKDHARLYQKMDRYKLHEFPNGWRIGFEVKTNKRDLLTDIKQRWKQSPLSRITNETYLLLPRGILEWELVNPGPYQFHHIKQQLPWGMGIIEVWRDERPQWKGILRAKITKLSRYNMNMETPGWLTNRLLITNAAQANGIPKREIDKMLANPGIRDELEGIEE